METDVKDSSTKITTDTELSMVEETVQNPDTASVSIPPAIETDQVHSNIETN